MTEGAIGFVTLGHCKKLLLTGIVSTVQSGPEWVLDWSLILGHVGSCLLTLLFLTLTDNGSPGPLCDLKGFLTWVWQLWGHVGEAGFSDRAKPSEAVNATVAATPHLVPGLASERRGRSGRTAPGWMVRERGTEVLGKYSEVIPSFSLARISGAMSTKRSLATDLIISRCPTSKEDPMG